MERLVLCGHATDGCTYAHDWTVCFNYQSKGKAQDDFDFAWFMAVDNENNFVFQGMTIWTNEDSNDYKILRLEEWFNQNVVN